MASSTNLDSSGKILSEGGADFTLKELAIQIGTRFLYLLEGVLIIIVGILIIRYVRRYMQRIQVAHETQRMALNLLEKLLTGFLAVITTMLALKVIGLDLTLLISSVALGLSFGLKDIIKNYVSGILILFKSPFKIGDVVRIKNFIGKIERVDFQSTTLKTFDGREVTIYNKDVLSRSIVNYSKEDLRRLEIPVTLGHGTDVYRAMTIFEAILTGHDKVQKDPRFSVIFSKFSDGGMRFVLRFWIRRPVNILRVRSEIALQIEEAFDEVSVFSPYTRGVEFENDIGITEGRKERLRVFFSRPEMAAIAVQTAGQIQTAMAQAAQTMSATELEEPEV